METLEIGTMYLERETKGTVVYSRTAPNGRKESQYVQKTLLGSARPEQITISIAFDSNDDN